VDFSRRWGALGMSDLLANAASLLPHAAISCGSSVVSYWEHTSSSVFPQFSCLFLYRHV
jgi:hypothetical protein